MLRWMDSGPTAKTYGGYSQSKAHAQCAHGQA